MKVDSPDLVIAKRLLDHAKLCGYEFRRAAPGADGPLVGRRVNDATTPTGEDGVMGKDKDDDGKHREKTPDGDKVPPRPINPKTPREPKPGKRGK